MEMSIKRDRSRTEYSEMWPLPFQRSQEPSISEPVLEHDAGDDFLDLEKLHFLRFHGLDKQGRPILAIVGKCFPGNSICKKRLLHFMIFKIWHECLDTSFVLVYFEARVTEGNNPGILRWIYEGLPKDIKQRLEAVYFVHPGLRSRFCLWMLGRFFLSEGLYWKINYVSRVEFLWEYMENNQIEIPEFVKKHEEEVEYRPVMEYGINESPLLVTQMDVPAFFSAMQTGYTYTDYKRRTVTKRDML